MHDAWSIPYCLHEAKMVFWIYWNIYWNISQASVKSASQIWGEWWPVVQGLKTCLLSCCHPCISSRCGYNCCLLSIFQMLSWGWVDDLQWLLGNTFGVELSGCDLLFFPSDFGGPHPQNTLLQLPRCGECFSNMPSCLNPCSIRRCPPAAPDSDPADDYSSCGDVVHWPTHQCPGAQSNHKTNGCQVSPRPNPNHNLSWHPSHFHVIFSHLFSLDNFCPQNLASTLIHHLVKTAHWKIFGQHWIHICTCFQPCQAAPLQV